MPAHIAIKPGFESNLDRWYVISLCGGGAGGDVHSSIRGIHTSCCTENWRQSCLPHSPSQKCYTAQLFPRLSIKSRDWRTQHFQSQAGRSHRRKNALCPGRRWTWGLSFLLMSHNQSPNETFRFRLPRNHYNKWMEIIGYTTNLAVGIVCLNDNGLNEIIKWIENEYLDFSMLLPFK